MFSNFTKRVSSTPMKAPIARFLTLLLLVTAVFPLSGFAQVKPAKKVSEMKKPNPKPAIRAVEPDLYDRPSLFFGLALGSNINFFYGTNQALNAGLSTPEAFRYARGSGLYFAPLLSYHQPESMFGFMLQAGYDNRSARYNSVRTPCDCPADLDVSLSYLTLEPSLRIAPFKNDFYIYGGPRFARNLAHSFVYDQGVSALYPNEIDPPAIDSEFDQMEKNLLSWQIGAGYNIPLTSQNNQRQFDFSPFVSFQPYFGQSPRSVETWTLTTLRVGAEIKFGYGKERPVKTRNEPVTDPIPETKKATAPADSLSDDVKFTVLSPKNIPTERRIRETFAIRNYVFFDLGSAEIPERYVQLTKNQVKDFGEDRMETFTPKRIQGRSMRELQVYYNVLNVVGDRMIKNPKSTITLVGSSENGPVESRVMAMNIKKYLTSIFGIGESRIGVEARMKPKIPSEQPGATKELELIRQGDRRVSIESKSPAMLMEYQTGPNAPLKSVELLTSQPAPINSYVSFMVESPSKMLENWSLDIRDSRGNEEKSGPYTQQRLRIPGQFILGAAETGDYTFIMTGTLKSGRIVTKTATAKLNLWKVPEAEEGIRYSVIYEYNDSKTNSIYKKYLTEVVAPKIPLNATVIIHGYTDIIGNEFHNEDLSLARAMDVKAILEAWMKKNKRDDVFFDVYGLGEDQKLSPFENNYPEERFYNRTVLIDIQPRG